MMFTEDVFSENGYTNIRRRMDPAFIRDIYLLDFYEKNIFFGSEEDPLWYYSSIYSLLETLRKNKEYAHEKDHLIWISNQLQIGGIINNVIDIIHKILYIGIGKISLCGLCINKIICCYEAPDEYDLYIHSCTITEANVLVASCLKAINKEKPDAIYYISEYQYIIIDVNGIYIRIYLEVYKDRNQLLRNNGTSLEKHGFDPEVGYFSTTSALALLIAHFLPLDESAADNFYEDNPNILVPYGIHDINRDVVEGTQLSRILCSFEGSEEDTMYFISILDINLIMNFIPNSTITYEQTSNISTKLYTPKYFPKADLNKYLDNYIPIIVGISDDRYIAFIGSIPKLHSDIIKLLMTYWLEAEYTLAKQRVLN